MCDRAPCACATLARLRISSPRCFSPTGDPIWASTNVTWVTFAQSLGALLVMTEHRFYGESQPFADLSTENLQYLTSEQVWF